MFIFRLFSMTYMQAKEERERIRKSPSVGNFNTRTLRWIIAALAIFQLSACSVTTLGYNTLPSLMVWQVDRYFHLTDAQKSMVNERLTALHRWHRSNELPVYVKFLNEADDRLQVGPADEATLSEWRTTVMKRWPVLVERLAPGVAELMLTLSPDQLQRAKRKLAEDNDKYKKEYLLDGQARLKARLERYTKRAEFFVGDLDDRQSAYLRQIALTLPPAEEVWFAERQARQAAFFALAEKLQTERASQTQANEAVTQYLLKLWTSKDPQRVVVMERSAKASDQLSAEILKLANADQRAHLRKKLKGYAEDFAKLALQ
jgi:Family of unknown function (DUF6279)